MSEASTAAIDEFISKLEIRQSSFKNDKNFLRYVFCKTHNRFLKKYKSYCTFSELLNDGTYNCLSGTALYALLLDHFSIAYEIIETNYHIFLMIKSGNGDILFEATDGIDGFVDESSAIEARMNKYKTLQPAAGKNICYHYHFNFFNKIGLEELVGLMYYNLSIEAYNDKQFAASIYYLNKATSYYRTQRTEEFSGIILRNVIRSSLSQLEKENYLKNLLAIRKRFLVLASVD